jgi:hypothetical protein
MNQSENINELAMALSKAQGEITPAIKDSANPFFKSKYADLTSVWAACREPLTKHGLAVTQTMVEQDGKLILITMLLHASGQWIKSFLPIVTQKPDAQSLGAAITYMRRFSLSALVGICPEDDDGNIASGRQVIAPVQHPKISREQFLVISKKLDLVPDYKAQVKTWLTSQGIHDLMDTHASMFDGIIKAADKAYEHQHPVEKSA